MMRSNYQGNHHDDDEDDDFAPNPFRSTGSGNTGTGSSNSSNSIGGMDFFETPNPMSHNNSNNYNNNNNNNNYYSQPDPNTGMVGTLPPQLYPQQQQPPAAAAATYLTGTMDQLGGPNHNKSAAGVPPPPPPNFLVSFLTSCCLPYHQIQSLFDVDTIDIYIRIKATIWNFHQPNYFRLSILGARRSSTTTTSLNNDAEPTTATHNNNNKGPDLYGPIWISMTCMFILGITANINDYYRHVQHQQQQKSHNNSNSDNSTNSYHGNDETVDQEFEYDLTHLLNAMYLCFTYTFGISTFFWLVCICMGFHNSNNNHTSPSSPTTTMSNGQYLSWVYWVCHYGYSLVPILIGTCLAWILPYTLYHWIVLGTATFCSSLFIIRNLSTPLLEQDVVSVPDPHDPLSNNGTFGTTTTTTSSTHAKAAPILLSILGVHFTFLLVLKLTFYP